MRSLKFARVDLMRNRRNIKLILLLEVIALYFARSNMETGFIMGLIYVVFMGNVFCNTVFSYNSMQESGFLLLLPGSVKHRICGRFLFGVAYFMGAAFLYWVLALLIGIRNVLSIQGISICLIILLIGIMVSNIEFVLFYLVGETKSQMTISLIRVVPPLLFFFGGFYTMNHLGELAGAGGMLFGALLWVDSHLALCVVSLFVLAVIFTCACIRLCTAIISRRDYA